MEKLWRVEGTALCTRTKPPPDACLEKLIFSWDMTNVSAFEGLLACALIFICTCAHIKRVKVLKPLINDQFRHFGPLSIFNKAAVIGIRLQVQIGISCIVLAIYMLAH
jgi:uncharacterized membrane protein